MAEGPGGGGGGGGRTWSAGFVGGVVHVRQPGVRQGLPHGDAAVRVELQHPVQQVQAPRAAAREGRRKIGPLRHATSPRLLSRPPPPCVVSEHAPTLLLEPGDPFIPWLSACKGCVYQQLLMCACMPSNADFHPKSACL